jgi:Carboxypeptidase regulatory-like domain
MLSLRKGVCVWAASALFAFFGHSLHAQQVFGSIVGTVTDPSGSAVNNAKVTITETTKGTSFDTNTNESGNYTKGQLIPGTYQVTIEAPGFQKAVSSPIPVQVDQASRFDAALQVGNVNQQVEVTAAAPLLQTDRADVAQTFTGQQLNQLPNIGRNVQSFELLNPGTVKTPWSHATDEDPQGSVQTMVNGQLFSATGYQLDGTVNQDPILGIIVVNPTVDSVNEVKQANQDYDAEFSYMGGGLLTYSTKSGSNALHGDAFEYLFINTPGFQDFGRDPFNQNTQIAPGVYTPTTHQNQFGGSIGGRIIKDKLFFFGDAQLTRRHEGGSITTTVPTAAERTGDLSDWLAGLGPTAQIYDPSTGNPNGRTPFPGNVIPKSRLNPQALNLLSNFPLPNSNQFGTTFRNNFSTSLTQIITGNLWNTRWDYYLNEKNTVFGRYSYAQYFQDSTPAFGFAVGGPSLPAFGFGGHSQALNQSIAGGWTHTANPTLINEFRFGYMRYHVTVTPGGVGTSPATAAGIPGLNLDNYFTSGMPNFSIFEPGDGDQGVNGRTQLGYALNNNRCNCPLEELERQYQFIDNVSKIHGNHTFKFGADLRYAENLRIPSDNHRSGEVYFDPGYTGQVSGGSSSGGLGLGTFLLGEVTNFKRYVSSSLDAEERQKRFFWYGQDQWRFTPKLTISLGVRWEMVFPETVNQPGNGATGNFNNGLMYVFGIDQVSSHGIQNMNWKEFAPRVGFAYQVTAKTVVRAGYGWSYNLSTFGSTFGHNVTQNPPVLTNQNIAQANNFSGVFTLASGPPPPPKTSIPLSGTFPIPNGVTIRSRPPTFTMPVIYVYNGTVEQQVTNKISVSAGYVGNSGRHNLVGDDVAQNNNVPFFIPGNTNLNAARPFNGLLGPRYNYGLTSDMDYYCNCANSRYDSFQATFKVNAMAGWTLQGNYTYQISQGDGWGSAHAYTFQYDRKLGYGYSNYIPHQQWVFAQNYDIPFGRGRKYGANMNRAIDFVLGGWNLSGITTYYSGIPFNPNIGTFPAGYARPNAGPNDRPDKGSASPYSGVPKNRNQWFAGGFGGAFLLPAPNTFGNYPIYQLYGPHYINQDVSIAKTFRITERFGFTLRTDFTNVFNHANLSTDSMQKNITDPKAGQITDIAFSGNGGGMRRLQYSGTITF